VIPTYFLALVVLSALLARGTDNVLQWGMFWTLFGASAAFQLPVLGGASIAPAVAFLPFLMLASLRSQGVSRWIQLCRDGEPGFWLLLVVIWAVVGALFLPRLFAGEVDVLTIDRMAAPNEPAMRIMALRPVSTNISQAAYALGNLAAFLAVRAMCRSPAAFITFNNGVIVLAFANVIAALLNMAELYLGIPSGLAFVRNGGYAILDQSGIHGLERVYGTFPEASSFAGFSLPLAAYLFSLWRAGVRRAVTGPLVLVLTLILLVSTSSTAYASMALYALAIGLMLTWRALTGRGDAATLVLVGMGTLLIAVIAIVGVVMPSVLAPVQNFFDITLFGKLESASAMERGSWNQHAWNNFIETSGIGVGLGSARASSYPLVLLSNLGAIGTALMLLFLLTVFTRPNTPPLHPGVEATVHAARHAIFVALIVASISATVFDLGVAFYALAAVASGYQFDLRTRRQQEELLAEQVANDGATPHRPVPSAAGARP